MSGLTWDSSLLRFVKCHSQSGFIYPIGWHPNRQIPIIEPKVQAGQHELQFGDIERTTILQQPAKEACSNSSLPKLYYATLTTAWHCRERMNPFRRLVAANPSVIGQKDANVRAS